MELRCHLVILTGPGWLDWLPPFNWLSKETVSRYGLHGNSRQSERRRNPLDSLHPHIQVSREFYFREVTTFAEWNVRTSVKRWNSSAQKQIFFKLTDLCFPHATTGKYLATYKTRLFPQPLVIVGCLLCSAPHLHWTSSRDTTRQLLQPPPLPGRSAEPYLRIMTRRKVGWQQSTWSDAYLVPLWNQAQRKPLYAKKICHFQAMITEEQIYSWFFFFCLLWLINSY